MSTAAQKLRQRAIKTNLLVRCEWCRVCVWRSGDLANFYYIFLLLSDFISHFTAGFPGLGQYLCAPVTRSGQRLYTAPSPSPALSLRNYYSFVSTYLLKPLISVLCPLKRVQFPEFFTNSRVSNLKQDFVVLHESDEKNVCGGKIARELWLIAGYLG